MKRSTRGRARLLLLALPLTLALLAGGTPPAHAAIAGGGEADGAGQLEKFPCSGVPSQCHGSFSGLTSGNSTFEFPLSGTHTIQGNLTWSKLPIAGGIAYTDGTGPYCPWWGNSVPVTNPQTFPNTGYWNFDSRTGAPGIVSGMVTRTDYLQGGNVTNVWGNVTFKWLRVGATAEVELAGTVTMQYVIPGRPTLTYGPVNWTGHGLFGFAFTTPTAVTGCIGPAATNVNFTTGGTFNILA
jgi:hypothetical protein